MSSSARAWKVLVCCWAVLVLAGWLAVLPDTLHLVKTRQMPQFDYTERQAANGVWGACERVVDAVIPGGTFDKAGVKPGDVLVGHASGSWRWDCSLVSEFLEPGQQVQLDVRRGGQAWAVQVAPQARPYRADFLFNNAVLFFNSPLVLAMGVLIAFRQPVGRGFHWLVIYFLAYAMSGFGATANTALPPEVLAVANAIGTPLFGLAPLGFFLSYPTPPQALLSRFIGRWVWPALWLIWPLLAVNLIPWNLGRHSLGLETGMVACLLITDLCVVIAIWSGWRRSDGEVRQRFKWIIAAFVAFVVFLPLGPLGWQVGDWQLFPVLNPLANLLGLSMLTYAILRHRVFDFEFAVNRTAVYSVTTLCLLIAFGVLEWAAEHLLQFRSRKENLIVDVSVALAVFLTFHRIRDWVEEWLEHLLFHAWRRREDQLRLDFRRMGFATQSPPMLDEMARAFEQFTGRSGVAIYMRVGEGGFDLARTTLTQLPEQLDENARLVLAVRESAGPVLAEEFEGWNGIELVLPIGAGHRPVGLAMIGPKPVQRSYRPDEIAVLAEVARHAGESLQAVRLSELLRENEQLRLPLRPSGPTRDGSLEFK